MELDEVHKKRFEDLDALRDIRATSVVWAMVGTKEPNEYVRKLHSAVATVRDIMSHEDLRESLKVLARIAIARDQASLTIKAREARA